MGLIRHHLSTATSLMLGCIVLGIAAAPFSICCRMEKAAIEAYQTTNQAHCHAADHQQAPAESRDGSERPACCADVLQKLCHGPGYALVSLLGVVGLPESTAVVAEALLAARHVTQPVALRQTRAPDPPFHPPRV